MTTMSWVLVGIVTFLRWLAFKAIDVGVGECLKAAYRRLVAQLRRVIGLRPSGSPS